MKERGFRFVREEMYSERECVTALFFWRSSQNFSISYVDRRNGGGNLHSVLKMRVIVK